MKGILFIISSTSGGGKGTLIKEVLKSVPGIGYSVSYSTRKRREGETHGKDYFFVSGEEFKQLMNSDEFLEYAEVHGNLYGTSQKQVEKEINFGRDVILEIDVQGAESIKKRLPESVGIFILPPSFEVLRQRLISRQTENESDLELRLKNARTEVNCYNDFDYVVINDDKEKALEELKTIIFAERLRGNRQTDRIRDILNTFNSTED
ncbi:MAG TPA: guanylate kinase [Pyrinomonadaceae bacterium]|nr:guanylate kinase [Pyrinomonadaceae bacterium]